MNTLLINDLKTIYPDIDFKIGNSFFWSPENKEIVYNDKLIKKENGKWALLHEVAHAKLNHINYDSDLGLLKLEVDAWEEAKIIAKDFSIDIDEDHIQDCLDTYRDWLFRRSSCPNCDIVCLQLNSNTYKCHNCFMSWSVSTSRFCRPYRLRLKHGIEKRLQSRELQPSLRKTNLN